jgi:hypothetical protein
MARKKLSTGAKVAIVAAVGAGVYFVARAVKAKGKEEVQPTPEPEVVPEVPPQPSGQTPKRPSGHPSPYGKACFPPAYGGSNAYDTAYWEAGGTVVARQRIFDHFESLGYQTPDDRDTMNDLGPDGKLGNDDVPNSEVRRFQKDYNTVSRWGGFLPKSTMGGLDEDGMVGPCTLNGLKLVFENITDKDWPELKAEAKNSGY